MKLKESYFRFLARLYYQYLIINPYDEGDIIFHKLIILIDEYQVYKSIAEKFYSKYHNVSLNIYKIFVIFVI